MPMTSDPVLEGLIAQSKQVYAKGQAIIGNEASDAADLAKAETYFKEYSDLQSKIEQRNEWERKRSALMGKSAEMDRWANEPIYPIPFSGKGGRPGQSFINLGRIDTGQSEVEKLESSGGFKSLGHFAYAQYKTHNGTQNSGDSMWLDVKRWDELQQKAPSGMFEQSDPDGGALIPREFSNQIYQRMVAKNLILQYISPIVVTSNAMTLPALKEDSRADGFRGGGILGYWDQEAGQYTVSKSRFRAVNLRLNKLTVYTFCTDELVNDSPVALQTFLLDKAPQEINFKINDAVINGTGGGMPLGVMNSNSLITASAVSGQGANTFTYANVLTIFSRVVAGQRGSMIWMYNQNVEPQLFGMYVATGTAAGVLIFTPNEEVPGGFKLMGRPALVMEQCQSLGTAGDVIAFSPEGYACITKGGIESFMSMHLRFDYDESAFKWRFRFDGQPYDNVPLTPYKGSTTVSSMVVLSSTRT